MKEMTLSELKAENAALEQQAAQPEVEEAEDIEEVEPEPESEIEDEPESESIEQEGEEETEEQPEWLKSEEDQEEGKKFTDRDIGAAKQKLREKLERKHTSEVDELKQKIAELESRGQAPQATAQTPKPKREDFYEADDPDEAYMNALFDWREKEEAIRRSQEDAKAQQAKSQERIETAFDSHIERAAEMLHKNGISEDVFNQAQQNVIEVVERSFPNMGVNITKRLISIIGEDSEKVIHYLGRNPSKLSELETKLRNDPEGFEAVAYLGGLKRDFQMPAKRKSTAPKPAPALSGSSGGATSEKAMKRRYDEAHKRGDRQKAFTLKREAKAAGFNTRNW